MKKANEERILQSNPKVPRCAGIYILTREEQPKCYIGQSVNVLERLGSHLAGYQSHVDLSLRTHKLYSEHNPHGWKISFIRCNPSELDRLEREYIQKAIEKGYSLYNVTDGGQGAGKTDIGERRPTKGYKKGVEFGYAKAQKEIANLFEKHLNVSVKKEGNKNQLKALEKFHNFLNYHKGDG